MDIKGVIFDLDGTLLNTAHLSTTRRSPWLLLETSDAWRWTSPFDFAIGLPVGIQQVIGELRSNGIKIGIVTRSPLAYATTALQTAGFTYDTLLASKAGGTTASRLKLAIEQLDLEPNKTLYVGDLDDDADAARIVGAQFGSPFWAMGSVEPSPVFIKLSPASPSLRYLLAAWPDFYQLLNINKTEIDNVRKLTRVFRTEVGTSLFETVDELFKFKSMQLTRILERRETFVDLLLWPRHSVIGDELEETLGDISHSWQSHIYRGAELKSWLEAMYGEQAYWGNDFTSGESSHLDIVLRDQLNPWFGEHLSPDVLIAYEESLVQHETELVGKKDAPVYQYSLDPIVPLLERRIMENELIPRSRTLHFLDDDVAQSVGAWLAEVLDGKHLDSISRGSIPGLFLGQNISWYRFREDWDYRFAVLAWLGLYIHQAEAKSELFSSSLRLEYQELVEAGFEDILSAVHYWDPAGQSLWINVKDWKGTRSGSEVMLAPMDAVAVVLAAKILHWCRERGVNPSDTLIVPVPATSRTIEQPGEISLRLAAAISFVACIPYCELVDKQGHSSLGSHTLRRKPKKVFVVDDQLTEGKSLATTLKNIHSLGVADLALSDFVAVAWTHSRPRRSFAENQEAHQTSAADELNAFRAKLAEVTLLNSPTPADLNGRGHAPWLSNGGGMHWAWDVEPEPRLTEGMWIHQGLTEIGCPECGSGISVIFRRHYVTMGKDGQLLSPQHYIAIACFTCKRVRTPASKNKREYALVHKLDTEITGYCNECRTTP